MLSAQPSLDYYSEHKACQREDKESTEVNKGGAIRGSREQPKALAAVRQLGEEAWVYP